MTRQTQSWITLLRRKSLLALTGLKRDLFNSMLRRGLLPLPSGQGDNGWNDYEVDDALAIVMASQLANQGVPQLVAKSLVAEGFGPFLDRLSKTNGQARTTHWFGSILLSPVDLDGEGATTTRLQVFGTSAQIAADRDVWLAQAVEGDAIASQITVNVNYCMSVLLMRAKKFGFTDPRLDQLARLLRV